MLGMGDIQMDAPGGTKEKYGVTLRFDRERVEDRISEHQLPISINKAVLPDVKEWAKDAEFKSEIEPFPDEFKL
jgi:hypothetical protein